VHLPDTCSRCSGTKVSFNAAISACGAGAEWQLALKLLQILEEHDVGNAQWKNNPTFSVGKVDSSHIAYKLCCLSEHKSHLSIGLVGIRACVWVMMIIMVMMMMMVTVMMQL